MMTSKLFAAASLLVTTSLVGCVDTGIGEEGEEIELGETEQAVGSCTYRLAGAAITKQIVSIEEPVQILTELVTVTDKPYTMNATSWTYPAGFRPISLSTTSCSDMGTGWKCRHTGVIEQTTATSGTGAYAMSFTPVADAGSGCGNATTQTVNFWLTTESFEPYQLDTYDSEALLFPAWNFGGTAFGLQVPNGSNVGYAQFIGEQASVNDVASSIKVKPGYSVTLYETAWFSGRSVTFTADHPWIGDGSLNFNDIASSAIVRKL